jgi:hypothetical protein
LAVGSDAVVSTNWIQVGIESAQRRAEFHGEPDRLDEVRAQAALETSDQDGPAYCRCPFEPRWSVSETIRLRNPVGVSLVAQGFLLPSADIMHLSVARQIEGTARLQHTSNELQASENSFSAG